MLLLKVRNTSDLAPLSDYEYEVLINTTVIASGKVRHRRANGWRALVAAIAVGREEGQPGRLVCNGGLGDNPCPNAQDKLQYLTPNELVAWTGELSCDHCGNSWYGVTFSDGMVTWRNVLSPWYDEEWGEYWDEDVWRAAKPIHHYILHVDGRRERISAQKSEGEDA